MWTALVILALAGASGDEARKKGSEQKAPNTNGRLKLDGAFDILGLRLGIPADMAAKDPAIEGIEGAKVSAREAVPLGSAINISNADDFSSVEAVLVRGKEPETDKEYLRVEFSNGDSPNVMLVRRVHRYPVNQRPLVSKLTEALVEKYGKPLRHYSGTFYWMKNDDADVIDACGRKVDTDSSAYPSDPGFPSRYAKCGTLMIVSLLVARHDKLDEYVVNGIIQTAADASAMMASSNRATAVLEAAKAEARAKEQQKASSVQPGKL